MDFNNDVLIVDIANIRDDDPEHGKTRMREGRRVRMSSIPYIDSALSALQVAVPAATILKIADYSLQYNFPESEKSEFLRRTNLEPTDRNYIYLLPLQPRKEHRKKSLFSRKPVEDPNFVEADDIILALAAELEACVISGDFYVDEKFNRRMKSIRDRLFVQCFNRETGLWRFVKSEEYFKTNRSVRNNWEKIESYTSIGQVLVGEKIFDQVSDFEIRNFAFNTMIEEFWANKKVRITVHQNRRLTSLPFRNVKPGVLMAPDSAELTQKVEVDNSDVSIVVPSREVERLPHAAQKIVYAAAKKSDLSLPSYYAASIPSISKHDGERVAVLGMIVRAGPDVFVEWVLSNLRIQVRSNSYEGFPRNGEIVRITGVVERSGDRISLRHEAIDLIDLVPFTELVQRRVKAARSSELTRPPTNWSLPSLRWHMPRRIQIERQRPINQVLPLKPSSPTSAVVLPPQKTEVVRQSELFTPTLNWFDAQNLEELSDFQLLATDSGLHEVELADADASSNRKLSLRDSLKVVIGVAVFTGAIVLIYFFRIQ